MKKRVTVVFCVAALAGASQAAVAADQRFGTSFLYGWSNDSNTDVDMYQGGFQWDLGVQWLPVGNWHLGSYIEGTVGYWDNNSPRRTNSGLWDVGITPVLRIQQTDKSTISPFLEAAAGVHYLSETSVSADRRFGCNFSFGDHVGVGVRFGPRHAFELMYRYQHLSNLGICSPNQGINFNEVRLGYWF
ncbi:MAG: acyloxyacyl hydrolase [Burkholderiales bacterium]